MENLSDVHLTDFIPSIYTTPCTLRYTQNGKPLERGIFAERNGVLIIVYNKTQNALTLVRQFRPSVYLSRIPQGDRVGTIDTGKYPASLGITLEFCAGLEDKTAPTEQIAREEILEECGYDVPLEKLEKIATFKNLTETTGARSTMYYCEVTDDMRVAQGGGVDDEIIDVVEMPVEEVLEYAQQGYVNSPMNFMFGLQWFLYHKYKRLGPV
ncbi:uridine diphosphate glucose pyrophosphatase NUDT14 [Tribolium castaneum]|uniref:Uridine diphosphate glucose pyrophosphatase NUDT14 n=1 Tax=Tribolium castaneum TaxID=7070 RepID=D2A6C4_TRICA|nr:PREDICTED: uridine diphosphate glucose pyrophosphatase [Tribolium castaneum]EFA04948.1 Uridine diphosphate glucose pyrophosphatase-like Protein [Tribolium castaneum]|eukprot:XP_015836483.1 PREDICTED: uridine diphosphate glucose pyrophosphatase [Tribolium castaneum]